MAAIVGDEQMMSYISRRPREGIGMIGGQLKIFTHDDRLSGQTGHTVLTVLSP